MSEEISRAAFDSIADSLYYLFESSTLKATSTKEARMYKWENHARQILNKAGIKIKKSDTNDRRK